MKDPPLGPGGEDITWPNHVAPWGPKVSNTRNVKPQTSDRWVQRRMEVLPHPGILGGPQREGPGKKSDYKPAFGIKLCSLRQGTSKRGNERPFWGPSGYQSTSACCAQAPWRAHPA